MLYAWFWSNLKHREEESCVHNWWGLARKWLLILPCSNSSSSSSHVFKANDMSFRLAIQFFSNGTEAISSIGKQRCWEKWMRDGMKVALNSLLLQFKFSIFVILKVSSKRLFCFHRRPYSKPHEQGVVWWFEWRENYSRVDLKFVAWSAWRCLFVPEGTWLFLSLGGSLNSCPT